MAATCDLIISVCPPSEALAVAEQLTSYVGTYVDANAISPETARAVAKCVESGGAIYVDGGIVGPPPTATKHPHLFLSGPGAFGVAEVFERSWIFAHAISAETTAASALKVCYAAWTKGTSALLLDIRALASAHGVDDELITLWRDLDSDLEQRSIKAGVQAATKGWRWLGEMHEIASSFRAEGLPDGFHQAAAEVFARQSRDEAAVEGDETLRTVIEALRHPDGAR
jgi:hypothetical protein